MAVSASVPSMTMLPPERSGTRRLKTDSICDSTSKAEKIGWSPLVAVQDVLLAGHDVAQELARALEDVFVVDVDLVDVGGEEVADRAQDDVVLAVDQRRRALVARRLLHALPQAQQVGEVARQLAGVLVEPGGGADDERRSPPAD